MRVLIIAILMVATFSIALAASRYSVQSALSDKVPCGDKEMEDKIRSSLLIALDEALQEHFKKTFEVWMKDETEQPARARKGVRQGMNAYLQVRQNLLHTFTLPECSK